VRGAARRPSGEGKGELVLVRLKEKMQELLPGKFSVEDGAKASPLVEILRLENSRHDGTFGVIKVNGRTLFACLERPWLNNKKKVSCIPAGVYLLKRVFSHEWGWTYEVVDVDDRTLIRFHWGNWLTDSKGCILVGEGFGIVSGKTKYKDGKRGITSSQRAFRSFIKELGDARWCRLIIHEVP